MSEEAPKIETPTETPTETAPQEGQSVPFARFQSKVEEVKALKAQMTDMGAQVEAAKGLTEESTTLKATHEEAVTNWAKKEALYQRGIVDPEKQDLANYRFSKSGEEDFGGWLDDGAKSDAIMKSVFVTPTPTIEAPTARPTTAPTITPPTANKGTRPAPPARAEITLETLSKMSVDEKAEVWPKLAAQWGFDPIPLRSKK
tara:strand:+ start:2178 stop:2780 length:603 start_codon:yes stop_codon:yes gene_type:complete